MKELVDVINEIKFGSVLYIDSNNENLHSYIRQYDGDIFQDIKTINLGSVFDQLSNIKKLLGEGYIYHIIYDDDNGLYKNIIHKGQFNISSKEIIIDQDCNIFETKGNEFIDSIIELDTKIANSSKVNQIQKRKIQKYA